jgi:hypothetical protein
LIALKLTANRLAVILHPRDYDRWLGIGDKGGDPRGLRSNLLYPSESTHEDDARRWDHETLRCVQTTTVKRISGNEVKNSKKK